MSRVTVWLTRLCRPVVIVLVLIAAGAVFQVLAWRLRHSPAGENRALTDTETTAIVVGDVSNGLSKIFSYAPDSTAATEQAAAEILDGKAKEQYRALFAQVKQQAAKQGLTLSTSVVRAGVTRLSGDTATVLVFLDQVATRRGDRQDASAAAQLSVTAHFDGDQWRIVDIHAR